MISLSTVRPRLRFSFLILPSYADPFPSRFCLSLFSAVAAGGMDTASTDAQPVASASAAPTTLAVAVRNASEISRPTCASSPLLHVWEMSNKRVAERLLVASQYTAYGETLKMGQNDFLIYVEVLSSAKGRVVVDMRQNDFLIYVDALNSAKCHMVVKRGVIGGTLLEAIVEEIEEGELFPDHFSDIIARADEGKQQQVQSEECENVLDEYVLLANTRQMLYLQNPSRAVLRDFTPEDSSVALDFLFGGKVHGETVKMGPCSVAWEFFLEFVFSLARACSKQCNVGSSGWTWP